MKKTALVFILGFLGATFQVNAQMKNNLDQAFLRRLTQDAKLIITMYKTATIADSSEKKFVELMKLAANATKWTNADRLEYIAGIKVLSNDLGFSAIPDEKGQFFVKGNEGTYSFYKSLFRKFNISNKLINKNKLLTIKKT